MTFRIASLNDGHDLTRFRSGSPGLDKWLHDHSRLATAQGTRTYVLLDDQEEVTGYFAIVPHVLDRDDAPRRLGRGAPRQIPSILLAKLALGAHLHGQGLGTEFLVRAIGKIIDAARVAGGKLIVVDAIDNRAADFYRHHDFEPLPDQPDRLVMKLSTAAQALCVDWP